MEAQTQISTEPVDLSANAVRQNLLDRARAYVEREKSSLSHIGREAIGDDRFLARVEKGENFTIRTYQRVLDWLDEQEAGQ